MVKNRFISFIIVIVAVAFVGYVIVDYLDNSKDIAGQPEQPIVENTDNSGSDKTIYNRINEVGLTRGMIAPDFTLQLWGTDERVSLFQIKL